MLILFDQIKYLRVPDTLLDAVKEEQTRAREAGRSARGAHVSGVGNARGMFITAFTRFEQLTEDDAQVGEVLHSDVRPSSHHSLY